MALLDLDIPEEGSYFDGGILQLTGYSLLAALLSIVTLGIGFPWTLCMLKRWETRHTVIENHRLEFDGRGLQLLGRWIVLVLLPYGLLIAVFPLIWFAGEVRSTALNALIGVAIILATIFYVPFVVIQIKRWEIKHIRFDGKCPVAASGSSSSTRAPLRLTSKDLVRADGMIEYCNYFDFANGVEANIRENLFRAVEPYISPDKEVVMAFAAVLDGTAGNNCACAFGATRFIIATENSVDVVPVIDIRGFSLEDKGLISVLVLQMRDRVYSFGVNKGRAPALLNTCRSSLKACQDEIEQKAIK